MTKGAEPWFARRFPLKTMRSGMAPVHWRGWAVLAGYVAALGASAWFGAWLIAVGQFGRGVLAFVIFAFGATLALMRIVNKKGDHINCVADYSEGKLNV